MDARKAAQVESYPVVRVSRVNWQTLHVDGNLMICQLPSCDLLFEDGKVILVAIAEPFRAILTRVEGDFLIPFQAHR